MIFFCFFTSHHRSLTTQEAHFHQALNLWPLKLSSSYQGRWWLFEFHDKEISNNGFFCSTHLEAHSLHTHFFILRLWESVFRDQFIQTWCRLSKLWQQQIQHLQQECWVFIQYLEVKFCCKRWKFFSIRFW